jgi:transcriptional repressor NF-X1
MREREAKRLAAEKARLEAEARLGSTAPNAGDGWAQVVSKSKKPAALGGDMTPPEIKPAASMGGSRFGALVLRSGVGMGRSLTPASGKPAAAVETSVADDWEEEADKVEREETGKSEVPGESSPEKDSGGDGPRTGVSSGGTSVIPAAVET